MSDPVDDVHSFLVINYPLMLLALVLLSCLSK